jgi:bifunctional DNA primase/polymerase-like protein
MSTTNATPSITPAKPRTLRQQHHDAMLQAAKNALELGVRNGINIHIFGAPYKTKVGRIGTHGSKDALGKFNKSGKDQTGLALAPWTGKYLAANPCIRLDYSGLVAIDVDQGFEGLTDDQMIAKAEANGLPRTYTVRTGRANGGATFFYRGRRMLPDCSGLSGFKAGELSGDIKHHGHVAAAGSLHKSGNFYRCINDSPFTKLPDFWRDYKHTKKAKPAPLTPFQEDCLRKEDLLRNADTSPLGLARKRAREYEVRLRRRLLAGEVVIIKHGELIPKGRRLKYLTQQAGRMRKLSLDPEIIRIALDLRAIQKCWDGENFIVSHKSNLDFVAGLSAGWEEGDYVMPTLELDGRVIYTKPPGRHDYLVAAMKKFPDQITATEGYDLLERKLVGTRFRFDRKSKASQQAVKEAREEAGFKVERPRGVSTWVRRVRRTIGD